MTASGAQQRFAALPALVVAALVTLGLLLAAQWHGFHRDELTFIVGGQHPAFGLPGRRPSLVATVREAAATLSPAQRVTAIVVTSNYGEAAAIGLLVNEEQGAVSGSATAGPTRGRTPDRRSSISTRVSAEALQA